MPSAAANINSVLAPAAQAARVDVFQRLANNFIPVVMASGNDASMFNPAVNLHYRTRQIDLTDR